MLRQISRRIGSKIGPRLNRGPRGIETRHGIVQSAIALGRPAHKRSLYRPVHLCERHYSQQIGQIDKPTYQLSFTCKACQHRSSHLVSKQAYHSGTVLIQCPSCKNRHLIADHLNVFGEGKQTLEEILKARGETVQKKTVDLSKLGDIEWEGPNEPPEQIDIKN